MSEFTLSTRVSLVELSEQYDVIFCQCEQEWVRLERS